MEVGVMGSVEEAGVEAVRSVEVEAMLACVSESGSEAGRSAGARYFRHLVSKESWDLDSGVARSRLVPALLRLLSQPAGPGSGSGPGEAAAAVGAETRVDALWTLTNLLCGPSEVAHAVVEEGGVEVLLGALRRARAEGAGAVESQALWALANVAGDCNRCRQALVLHGFLDDLSLALAEEGPSKTKATAVWAFSNLCRGRPGAGWSGVWAAGVGVGVGRVAELLGRASESEGLRTDAAWSLAYLAEGGGAGTAALLASAALPALVAALSGPAKVSRGALRALGNLVAGGDAETDAVVAAGGVGALGRLLRSLPPNDDESLRKEIVWALSNVAAGTEAQIWAVVREEGLLRAVVDLGRSEEGKVGREAGWLLSNAATGGNWEQKEGLLGEGAAEALAHQLSVQREAACVRGLLRAAEALLGPVGAAAEAGDPTDVRGRRLRLSSLPGALRSLSQNPFPHSPTLPHNLRSLAKRLLKRLATPKQPPKSRLPELLVFPY